MRETEFPKLKLNALILTCHIFMRILFLNNIYYLFKKFASNYKRR